MLMMHERLPHVHSFLRPAGLTRRSGAFLARLMLAFCCHFGRMTAAQAARRPRCDPRHPAAIGRFLGRQRWGHGDWMAPLRARRLAAEAATGGTFFFLLDQTCSSRQGDKTPNTFSTGNRQRRPQKGRRYSTKKAARKRCHAFVCGLLLSPGGLRLPYKKSYYTAEYAQQKGLRHRTQAELGADLIRELELPAGTSVVVLGDTAYEAACVHKACAERGFPWITPCNTERVLEGPKPRPKVRSLLTEVSAQRFVAVKVHPATDPYALQRRWSASRRGRQSKGRTYWVLKQRHEVHSVGVVSVFVSTTKRPKAGEPLHEPKILLSGDLGLTAREAVLRYTLRWQIEMFFKELKSVLGMADYRLRDFERVERWVEVALCTFMYLEDYRWRQLQRQDLKAKERVAWEAERTAGLCRAVRAAVEQGELLWVARRLRTPGGCRQLRRLVQANRPSGERRAG
jgi:Transposase DDE domain